MAEISEMLENAILKAARDLKLSKLYRAESSFRRINETLPEVDVKIQEIENQIVILQSDNFTQDMVEIEVAEVISGMVSEGRQCAYRRIISIYEMKNKKEAERFDPAGVEEDNPGLEDTDTSTSG